MFKKFLLATVFVFACSVDVVAQQPGQPPIRGSVVVNRTTINNSWGNPGWGWNGGPYGNNFRYTCVGCYPGAGPYDSAIAVAGIAAGASVINNIINSAAVNRQPAVVVNQAPAVVTAPPVYQAPGVYTVPGTVYSSGPNCITAPTGYSPEGVPVYQRYCRY